MVEAIKKTKSYSEFIQKKDLYNPKQLIMPPSVNIFNKKEFPKNNSLYIISVDIIKANYNAMSFYDPGMIFDTKTWEEFVSKFTKFKYFNEAKYFRQVVFGNLNSKKLGVVQKKIICDLVAAINDFNSKKENVDQKLEIMGAASNDEMIVKSDEQNLKRNFNNLQQVILGMGEKYSSILRCEPCKINLIHPEHNGFVKQTYHDLEKDLNDKNNFSTTFKGIPAYLFPQFYKYWFKQELHVNDLKFLFDNEYVVTFDEPLFGRKINQKK